MKARNKGPLIICNHKGGGLFPFIPVRDVPFWGFVFQAGNKFQGIIFGKIADFVQSLSKVKFAVPSFDSSLQKMVNSISKCELRY